MPLPIAHEKDKRLHGPGKKSRIVGRRSDRVPVYTYSCIKRAKDVFTAVVKRANFKCIYYSDALRGVSGAN